MVDLLQGENACSSHATCQNNSGSYTCRCKLGFEGDGKTCEDIDECNDALDTCLSGQTCKNTGWFELISNTKIKTEYFSRNIKSWLFLLSVFEWNDFQSSQKSL